MLAPRQSPLLHRLLCTLELVARLLPEVCEPATNVASADESDLHIAPSLPQWLSQIVDHIVDASKGDREAAIAGVDTTLIPPGTQCGATLGIPGQSKPLRNARFASLC